MLKVYLDNCCFNRPYDDQSQLRIELETKAKLFIQNLISNGKVNLVWSYMLEFENSNNPYLERKNAIGSWRELSYEYIDESEQVILLAEKIMNTGVKSSDALHVSIAINSGCDYFITTDDRIYKYKDDRIKIISPIHFLKDWSEQR